MPDCIFCQIVNGDIPGTIIYQNDKLVAFEDIKPQAPTHILFIPRKHMDTLNDLSPDDDAVVGEMVRRAGLIARELGHADSGYRAVLNCNADAGQTVFHLHLHLLAGRPMTWPPG